MGVICGEQQQSNDMKRYYDLSKEEKLALDQQAFEDAVRVEAIGRGFKPPITLDDAMKTAGYCGYVHPVDAVRLFEVIRPDTYGSGNHTGMCFRTEEEALNAMRGAISVNESRYGTDPAKIIDGGWRVQMTYVTLRPQKNIAGKLEDFEQDTAEFDKVAEECATDWATVRQERYNQNVRKTKRTEYLRLAKGDLDIARGFWTRAEGGEFPDENGN